MFGFPSFLFLFFEIFCFCCLALVIVLLFAFILLLFVVCFLSVDVVFGFPSLLRFSWRTATDLMEKESVGVQFTEWEEEDEEAVGGKKYNMFKEVQKSNTDRYRYFVENGMESVTQW